MNTMQAEYRTDIARLAEDMAKRDAARAEREAARAERDATARWWQTAILVAALAALITFAPGPSCIHAALTQPVGVPGHGQEGGRHGTGLPRPRGIPGLSGAPGALMGRPPAPRRQARTGTYDEHET